jgi:hypothetical protein
VKAFARSGFALILLGMTLQAGPAPASVPTCFGVPATIVGTSKADHLDGGPLTDVGRGGPGQDSCMSIEVADGCEN